MRKFFLIVLLGAVGVLWGADWSSQSGNPQRDGWARGEDALVKSKIPGLKLLYRTKLDNQSRGLDSLTSPVILSNLITYLGFKELLFVGGSSDNVYAIDAALNRIFWHTHFDYKGDVPQASPTATCPGGLTASVAITGGSGPMGFSFNAARKRAPGGPGVGPGQGGAAPRPAKTPDRPVASRGGLFSSGFGRNGYVFAIGSDGYLRFVRQSDGKTDAVAPVKFLPPNSNVSSINVAGTVVYAATVDNCGGSPNALYAVDLGGTERNVVSFPTNGSGLSGKGGTAVGNDGTVYAEVANGHGDVAGNYGDTVLSLDPESLKVKDYFTPEERSSAQGTGQRTGVTPAVFQWKGKDLIVAAGQDGTVYLLDSASLGGADHHTPLSKTEPIAGTDASSPNRGILGDFATWEDTDTGARWIYAAVQGGPSSNVKFPLANGDAESGSIVAFKVEEQNGKPALTPQWISRNLIGPASPVTTNGLVFALSTGHADGGDSGANADHATLYALDGATGKELFSSGDDVTTFSHGSGLAIADGRVYFTTHDNTVYCYGFPALEPQLTEH